MPKPKYNYTIFSIKRLLEDVSNKANINILTIADCEILSGILLKEKIILSKDTIARLYKIIPTKSIPYKNTLDKLCTFIGYNNWDNFYTQFRKENDENTVLNANKTDIIKDNELLLLKYCIEDNAFNPVINYLNKISELLHNPFSKDSHKIANRIGMSVKNNTDSQKILIPFITKNEKLRDIFFTWWVDIDALSLYYSEYIEKHYLKNLHPQSENFSNNEMWAYSILLYNSLYSFNKKEYAKLAYKLFKTYEAKNIVLTGRSDFYPYARFHSHHIIYNVLYKNKGNKWLNAKIYKIKNDINNINLSYKAVIISYIIEALSVCGKYELVITFKDDYDELLKIFYQKNGKFNQEEDSLVKMVFYFHFALNKLNILEENLNTSFFALKEKPTTEVDNFTHSYTFFFNHIKSYYSSNQYEKKLLIENALKHAAIINNSLLIKLNRNINS